jgi:hypothetical protein
MERIARALEVEIKDLFEFAHLQAGGVQETIGLRVNLLQIRLGGPYSATLSVNRTTVADFG